MDRLKYYLSVVLIFLAGAIAQFNYTAEDSWAVAFLWGLILAIGLSLNLDAKDDTSDEPTKRKPKAK